MRRHHPQRTQYEARAFARTILLREVDLRAATPRDALRAQLLRVERVLDGLSSLEGLQCSAVQRSVVNVYAVEKELMG